MRTTKTINSEFFKQECNFEHIRSFELLSMVRGDAREQDMKLGTAKATKTLSYDQTPQHIMLYSYFPKKKICYLICKWLNYFLDTKLMQLRKNTIQVQNVPARKVNCV